MHAAQPPGGGGSDRHRSAGLRSRCGSGPSVAGGQRRGAEAVGQDAEQYGGGDDGHGLIGHWSEGFQRQQREHEGSQAARTEPPHEQDGVPVEAGANRGQRHRQHAHHREAEHGIHDGQGDEVRQHDRNGDGSEGQPHEQGHQAAHLLDEDQFGRRPLTGARAERQPAAERGDESVAAHGECGGVGEQAQGQDADAGEVLGCGPAPAGQLQQPPAQRRRPLRRRRRR